MPLQSLRVGNWKDTEGHPIYFPRTYNPTTNPLNKLEWMVRLRTIPCIVLYPT